jgi:eukaryotic-like serine/threonine-protein kinase
VIGGTLDGKYRIVRLLGKGGMGVVYEAEDKSGRRVAIKVMHPRGPHDSDDDGHVGRFQREARAAATIDTDHIARVLDWGTDPIRASPYMVMEYLLGEDLQVLLKRVGVLRPDVALRVVAQACIGLQKAHESRVIHRDIKPANLYLARTGGGEVTVKILDFGIAKIRPEHEGGETTGLTRTGGMLGSPIYMSPEQARGIKAIDHRTDIWSLGVVLYRALSGHTPHDDTEALGDLIVSICSNVPRPIQELAPWVHPDAAAVAHGALRISPDERWPTAAAMLDAIRPLLPGGWTLREDMLVPMDETARAVVAPRGNDAVTTLGRKAVVAASVAPMPSPLAGLHETSGSVPASTATPPMRRSHWKGRAAGAAAIVAGVSGVAVYLATGTRVPMGPGAAGSGAVAGAEPPAGRASASSAPSAVAPATTRVALAVAPRDVTVLVDDAIAAVKEGMVEIQGTLGSVHHVRVSRGSVETSAEVVVTAGGPIPAKIELGPVAAARGPAAGGKVSGPLPDKPAGSAHTPAKPLIPDRFE